MGTEFVSGVRTGDGCTTLNILKATELYILTGIFCGVGIISQAVKYQYDITLEGEALKRIN